MRTSARFFRHAAAAAIAAALVATTIPVTAFAEDAALESLQNAAIEASNDYTAAQAAVDDLQQQIDQNEVRIKEIEAKLPKLRSSAASAIATSYKIHQDHNAMLSLLLSSDSFNHFITQVSYLNHIMGSAASDMNELVEAQSELASTKAILESQKADVQAKAASASNAYTQAEAAIEAAKRKALENAAENKAAYDSSKADGKPDQTVVEIEKASDDSASSGSSSSSGSSGSSSSSSGSSSSSSQDTGSSDVSYTQVEASMYGEGDGLMWGTTASGAKVTPDSMGVAMKTMPLGTIIEISYNGRTVRAVVNDRGPYAGNRQIDMQPAVAHALGFNGVGIIGYRVVG